ncbi:extensin-3-like [Cimex lectularius]|uniref:CPR type cuticle protein n=1 Tax=Cimex lectularius TaxID=79782 RepID=A0A8I6RNR5_CIMLE|nr:extensin-3-like [Cimex lectularius]
MKRLVLLCALSLASASQYFIPAPLNHDGTVADTHEVALLKHKHLAELEKAGGAVVYAPHYGDEHYEEAKWEENLVQKPYDFGHVEPRYHGPPAPLNHDGTVEETPEVKHAKVYHFAEHAKALNRLHYSHTPMNNHYEEVSYHSPLSYAHYAPQLDYRYHGPPAPLNHDGTVAETPEVKHAKAAHFAAHAAIKSHYPVHVFLADTPEVEHAKAQHYTAYHKVLHRGRRSPYQTFEHEVVSDHKYHGPPAPLKHDGTVDDTPEVKHAKAVHFAAHAKAKYGVHQTPAQYAIPVPKLQSVYHAAPVVFEPVHHTFAPVYQHFVQHVPFEEHVVESPHYTTGKYQQYEQYELPKQGHHIFY